MASRNRSYYSRTRSLIPYSAPPLSWPPCQVFTPLPTSPPSRIPGKRRWCCRSMNNHIVCTYSLCSGYYARIEISSRMHRTYTFRHGHFRMANLRIATPHKPAMLYQARLRNGRIRVEPVRHEICIQDTAVPSTFRPYPVIVPHSGHMPVVLPVKS